MARTPQEIFEHHVQALGQGDLEEIVADYADDALFITPQGVKGGTEGVRQGFTEMLEDLPDAEWELKTTIFEENILFLEWGAETDTHRVTDGIDTFVFRGEQILVQTVRYTLETK